MNLPDFLDLDKAELIFTVASGSSIVALLQAKLSTKINQLIEQGRETKPGQIAEAAHRALADGKITAEEMTQLVTLSAKVLKGETPE